MVRVLAAHLLDVNGNTGIAREGREKILDKLGVKVADLLSLKIDVHVKTATARNINGRKDQRLVHGKKSVAVARDTLLVADGLREGATEVDADVLNGVMVVDLGVSRASEREVKAAVCGKEGEHMAEEATACSDVNDAASVKRKCERDVCFVGSSFDFSCSHVIDFLSK